MNVINTCYNLLINSDSSFFMKSLVLDDVVKEFAIGAVLHNEIQLSLGFNNL
jgi:hypothetical protein